MLKNLKTVLHVLNSNSFSGAEKVVIDIIKNLNDDSINVIMFLKNKLKKLKKIKMR